MTAEPQRIGPYPIERELGRGGMGIVYLARDPKLHRPVAIKVLPDAFAQDPERLSRFEREARLLASLTHPNIAGIYGLEEAGGHRFLTLEYVEGETLAERLARGALPVNEALDVCRQIAAALEAAHESGVIHRDLKPGNVKLTPGGDVKVLDFGLAKGAGTADSAPNMSQSPTIAYAATGAGVILGTAAYMSPEQARGKVVDRRTDIWSFGCVLYECLTRRQLFAGETVSDMIAKILEREPDWSALPGDTPQTIRELLKRCLDKNAKQRLRDIGEARIELEEALAARTSASRAIPAAAATAGPASARAGPRGPFLAGAAAGLAVTLGAMALLAPGAFRRAEAPRTMRFTITSLPGKMLNEDAAESSISPDGKMVAFTAGDSAGNVQLWVRSLDALAVHPVPGSDNADLPFWSRDSRNIAFFADGKLKRVPAAGGDVETICEAKNGRGGTWNADDVIVFCPDGAGPLFKVPGSGGDPQPVTTLDSTRQQTAHRFPWFLPDGKHFLYSSLPATVGKYDAWVGSLDGSKPKFVTSAGSCPVYAAPGYLVFVRGRNLVAQKFDLGGLRPVGNPIPLPDVPAPSQFNGYRAVTASEAGDLAYANGRLQNTQLVWLDRSARETGVVPMPPGHYEFVSLSNDGKLAAVQRSDVPSESDAWLVDLESGVSTRFTFGPGKTEFPLFSPDGRTIVYESNRLGATDFFTRPADGSAPESLLYRSSVAIKNVLGWSPDGRSILFEQLDPKTGWDFYSLPADGHGPAVPIARTQFNERAGAISPDGQWIAYPSDESGQLELYVERYPQHGSRTRVSTGGAQAPFWRSDGRELVFYSLDFQTIFSCEVTTTPAFRTSPPRILFRAPPGAQIGWFTRDLKRYLVPVPAGDRTPATITVALNWAAGLAKR